MAYQATGLDWDQLLAQGTKLIGRAGPAVQAASKVIEDPALPEISCQLLKLNRINRGEPAGPSCPRTVITNLPPGKGVGLVAALRPIRAFMWARERPLVAGAVVGGALGLIWALGYRSGKRTR